MRQLEIAALGAADRLAGPARAGRGDGPKHAGVHAECLNCGATLHGRFRHACGQGADDHHRSIFHLIWEAVENLTHLDGRLARTLPPLFLRPGQLARDHFEGRRQRHVPPFRLFLVSLLLFMFALETRTHHSQSSEAGVAAGWNSTPPRPSARTGAAPPAAPPPAAAAPTATVKDLGHGVTVTTDRGSATRVDVGGGIISVGESAGTAKDPNVAFDELERGKLGKTPFGRWVAEHGRKALASKELFRATIFEWAHRLAILLLPIFAGILALAYCYRRRFYVYDHLVVSMHFLSFVFLTWAVAYPIPDPVGGFVVLAFAMWTPVNLFMTLRGAYGSSIAGAVVKTAAIWAATLVLFLLLLVGVIFVALGSL